MDFPGIISGPEDDSRQNSRQFWSISNSSNVILEPQVEDVDWWGSPQITRAICSLLKTGVHSFVSSLPSRYYPLLLSYAQRFHVPIVTPYAPTEQFGRTRYEVTLTPDPSAAIGSVLKYYKWETLTFFYDEDDGPEKLQKVLEASNHSLSVEAFWRISSSEEVRRYLQILQPKATGNAICILLAVKESLVDEILTFLPPGFPVRKSYHLVMMNPVGIISENNQRGSLGNYVLTKLTLTDVKDPNFKELENKWNSLLESKWHSLQQFPRRGTQTKSIPYSALAMKDIAEVLQEGFDSLAKFPASFNFSTENIECLTDAPRPQRRPFLASDYIKKVILPSGMTGNVQFSNNGERVNYKFNISEVTAWETRNIGTWSPQTLLKIARDPTKQEQKDEYKDGVEPNERTKIKVVSVLSPPYLKLVNNTNSESKTGNDRYEGFFKDILDKTADILGWDYELNLVKDGRYGTYDGKQWNGMVGELARKEADVVLAPLTMNSEREAVIDFSIPVMNLGLNILMKKPNQIDITSSSIGGLGFINVWSYEVWLLIALAYLIFSGSTYAVSRFIGEPDRIRSLDTKLSDRLSPCSSFWFALGSLVFRSTGIYPRYLSHRMLAIVMWVFSLLLLILYISSLTFKLIEARTASEEFFSRNTFSVLQSAVEKGYPKIGTVVTGSTAQFFLNSQTGLYKDFGKYMKENPDVLVKSYAEGAQRVLNSDEPYGIIMESPSSHLFANTEPCEKMVTSGFLIHRSYGFAFPKGSSLKEIVDHVVLSLVEKGELRRLYEKWWHLQFECEDPHLNILPNIYSNSLSLDEVSGVFYLFIIGGLIAIATGISEYCIQSKRLSVDK